MRAHPAHVRKVGVFSEDEREGLRIMLVPRLNKISQGHLDSLLILSTGFSDWRLGRCMSGHEQEQESNDKYIPHLQSF
jgi:hypothetical protein